MTPQLLRISGLALALLVATPALAQETDADDDTAVVTATTDDDAAVTTVTADDDRGFSLGWLGLLGLAGLAGLGGRRRDARVVTTTTR